MTTNPYYSYHATNTREYLALTTATITKFEPERIFKLNSSDASDFATKIESKAQQFGYISETARMATTCFFTQPIPIPSLLEIAKTLLARGIQSPKNMFRRMLPCFLAISLSLSPLMTTRTWPHQPLLAVSSQQVAMPSQHWESP